MKCSRKWERGCIIEREGHVLIVALKKIVQNCAVVWFLFTEFLFRKFPNMFMCAIGYRLIVEVDQQMLYIFSVGQ